MIFRLTVIIIRKSQSDRSNKSKYKNVGVLPIPIVKSNISSVSPSASSERNMVLIIDYKKPEQEYLTAVK